MLSTVDKEGVNDITKTAQTECGGGTRQTQVRDAGRAHLRKQRYGNGRYVTGLEVRIVYAVYRKVVIMMERI